MKVIATKVALPLPTIALGIQCLLGHDRISEGQFAHLATVDNEQGWICTDCYRAWEARQPVKEGWVRTVGG